MIPVSNNTDNLLTKGIIILNVLQSRLVLSIPSDLVDQDYKY